MANYRAVGNGNWSNLATWQDDSLGYFANSTVLPTTADDVYANNFTVTIDGTRNAFTIRNTAFIPPTNLALMSIPQMSSNTTPSGAAAASSVNGANPAWLAFDRTTGTFWQSTGQSAWLSYNFPTGRVIKRYGFFSHSANGNNPRTWTFEGSNNGSTWVVLDTQTNFVTGVSTFHSFDISANTTSYTYYRINVTAVQTFGSNVTIPELEMSEVTNLYGGTVAGGGFTFANGGNLTCSAPTNSVFNRAVANVYCLTFDLPSGQSATFNGSVNDVPGISAGRVILVQNTGTFNMVGDYGQPNGGNVSARYTIFVNASTTINIIGNITNSQISANLNSTLFINAGNPIINITGNVSGGNTNTFNAANGNGIYCGTTTTINLTGNITTNSNPSIWFGTSGTLNLIGNATGGTAHPAVYNINTPATIDILGTTTSGSGYPAIQGLITTFVRLRGNVINTDTYCAVLAGRVTIDNNVTSWQFKDSTNAITRTLYTAGVNLGNPDEDDVRDGLDYGPSLDLTGTMIVPPTGSVRKDVPVDNTVGTAEITASDLLEAIAISSAPIAVRLRNVSTVETTGNQIADLS
jgi:hypothetical protein